MRIYRVFVTIILNILQTCVTYAFRHEVRLAADCLSAGGNTRHRARSRYVKCVTRSSKCGDGCKNVTSTYMALRMGVSAWVRVLCGAQRECFSTDAEEEMHTALEWGKLYKTRFVFHTLPQHGSRAASDGSMRAGIYDKIVQCFELLLILIASGASSVSCCLFRLIIFPSIAPY